VPLPVATGEPLPGTEIEQILARLPALTAEPSDQADFRPAAQPIPPPRSGQTVDLPFPAPAEPAGSEPVASGPLKVLRFAPEGEIPIAPFINITFNQPMVALGTLADLAQVQVPVQVEPPLPGTWRWLGSRTLNFEYDSALIDRLPKATLYHVTIPAGTTSATGGVLAETVAWSFSTPPPKVTLTYPSNEPQPLEPLFFIQFDQRVNPAAVLKTLQVTAASQPVELELLSDSGASTGAAADALRADERARWLLKNALPGRWLAFHATRPLPPDVDVHVTVGPGTPSAEGPLLTQAAQSYSFRTYATLRVEDHGCSWGNDECRPLSPFFIRFNNPIDASAYREEMLRIEPQLPGASVNIFGNTLNIQGASQGQTTYTITVAGDIQDTFGQQLGREVRLTFRVGPAEAALVGPGQTLVTLDPASNKPVFSVYAINYPRLDLRRAALRLAGLQTLPARLPANRLAADGAGPPDPGPHHPGGIPGGYPERGGGRPGRGVGWRIRPVHRHRGASPGPLPAGPG
jgi:hypothetical protein